MAMDKPVYYAKRPVTLQRLWVMLGIQQEERHMESGRRNARQFVRLKMGRSVAKEHKVGI